MYGLLLESVRFYIRQKHGDKMWEALCRHCELTNSVFSSLEIYSDSLMPKFAEACSSVLPCGQPTSAYMEYFGKCFVEFTGNFGYSKVLKVYSRNFRDLLDSIDSLHEHLRFRFPKLQSPSFACKEESTDGLTLHYRSRRYGFKNYVIGQVKDLALRYFNLNINVEILKEENKTIEYGSKKYHVIYRIIFDNSTFMPVFNESKFLGLKSPVPLDMIFSISPFSFVIDKDLRIFRAAEGLNKYFGENMAGKSLRDVFIVRRPPTDLTWDELIYHERIMFELIAKQACNMSLFTNAGSERVTDFLDGDNEFLQKIFARKYRSCGFSSNSSRKRATTIADGGMAKSETRRKKTQLFCASHDQTTAVTISEDTADNRTSNAHAELSVDNTSDAINEDTGNANSEFKLYTSPIASRPLPSTYSELSSVNWRCAKKVECSEQLICVRKPNNGFFSNNGSCQNEEGKFQEPIIYWGQNSIHENCITPAKDCSKKDVESLTMVKCKAVDLNSRNSLDKAQCPHFSGKRSRDNFSVFDSNSCESLSSDLMPSDKTDTHRKINCDAFHIDGRSPEQHRNSTKLITMLRSVKDKLLKSTINRNIDSTYENNDATDSKNNVIEEEHSEEDSKNNVIEEEHSEEDSKNNVIKEKRSEEDSKNNVIEEKHSEEDSKNNVIEEKHSEEGSKHNVIEEKRSEEDSKENTLCTPLAADIKRLYAEKLHSSISRLNSLSFIENMNEENNVEHLEEKNIHSFPETRKKIMSREKEKHHYEKSYCEKAWRSKIKKWLQRQQFKPLHLRGQMKHIKEWNMVLFIGTPLIGSVDDLRNSGLFLSDLGMHDGSRMLTMQGTQRFSETEFAWDREKLKGQLLTDSTKKLEEEKRKTEYLLYSMMPREIAERMKNGDRELTTCETFDNVTILFGYIPNFTEICNKVAAMKVVQLVSELFSLFDILSENHKVYKFETIGGGVYMLVSGAPSKIDDHAHEMGLMAMRMLEEVQTLKSPLSDKPLELQIGIHSGPVVAGVIGQTTLQYCLFGNTVNISSRMQSTGKPMRIHLSKATNRELKASNLVTEHRGQIPIKGVGNLDTYWLVVPKDLNQVNNNTSDGLMDDVINQVDS